MVGSPAGRSDNVGFVETAVLALDRAQILFSVALGLVALLITLFAVYVTWSTMWSDRWYRKGPAASAADPESTSEDGA